MRFTFVTTRQFHTISRLWFGFAASPRIPRFDREPFNSTGGTFTHEGTNFTSARIPMLLEKVADAALRCPRAVQARHEPRSGPVRPLDAGGVVAARQPSTNNFGMHRSVLVHQSTDRGHRSRVQSVGRRERRSCQNVITEPGRNYLRDQGEERQRFIKCATILSLCLANRKTQKGIHRWKRMSLDPFECR